MQRSLGRGWRIVGAPFPKGGTMVPLCPRLNCGAGLELAREGGRSQRLPGEDLDPRVHMPPRWVALLAERLRVGRSVLILRYAIYQ